MMYVVYFLLWTLVLYWIHRLGHKTPIIRKYHLDHHRHILSNHTKWHWNNLLLYNDTRNSTIDLWITEVIPTLIFSYITGQWWLSVFYYLWASLIQESIEHNENFDVPFLTSGKWHLIHHRSNYNYGLFFPVWDIMFGTYKNVHE
jgi:sterol desaturase/sphingolipid hydroxylase (fatty acid hydroxylase superfamily)